MEGGVKEQRSQAGRLTNACDVEQKLNVISVKLIEFANLSEREIATVHHRPILRLVA
jgi:hypothetical protein